MPVTLAQLESVNSEVNECVLYTSDMTQWSNADHWDDAMDTRKDDCEGYAIAKLRKLLAANCEKKDLKIGLCYTELGDYHCVLVVTCDGDDWVLDNRYPQPMKWTMLPYQWDRFYLLGERKWRLAA